MPTYKTLIQVNIQYTPSNECSCQSECDAWYGTGCVTLNASLAADAQSYRFINFGSGSLTVNPCDGTKTDC